MASESERRPLTVVFCDLADSTILASRLDEEVLQTLIESAYDAWSRIIKRYGGTIVRYMGDGVLAYFGYPDGLESCPVRAAHAALEIIKLSTKPDVSEPRHVSEVAVRVGIATGVVVVGRSIGEGSSREPPAFGITPNLAARLQVIAERNTVVISAATRDLIAAEFECESVGSFELKGFAEPVPGWRVVGVRPWPSRFRAQHAYGPISIVGRQPELAMLDRLWTQVCGGAGRVLQISGDPGIGKSHLCEAFLQAVWHSASAVLRCQCSALHSNTAFHPVIEEIAGSAGISHADHAATRLDKLGELLGTCTSHVEQLIPVFARLLSLPTRETYPEFEMSALDARKRVIDGLVERLRLLAQRAPTVLFLEDAQWSDPSTQDFIAAAIERVRTARVLILITSRSEFTAPWRGAPHLTSIRVDRLDRGSIAELVSRVADQGALDESTRAQIVELANGVPLFAEELTRSMLVAGDAKGRADGGTFGKTIIPATLHDSLMSQLDSLGPARFVAQFGAIIGRTFPYWLLSRLWPLDEPSLRALLDEIVDAGLLTRHEQGSEEHYVFKHELLRDAAYESLLKGKRQPLHLRIAQIITSERARASGMRPELVAYHYTAAGLGRKAAPLWLEAGQLALRESANHEARASLRNGLECLQYLPEEQERWRLELRLQTCLGQALIAISGHASPEVLEGFSRAHELSKKMEEVPELFTIVWGITAHHLVKGDIRLHLDLSARLLDIAETSKDSGELIVAHTSRTLSLYFAGEFSSARRHLNEVLERYDWDRHRHLAHAFAVDRKMIALQFGTWTLWKLGYADQAARLEEELNSHVRRLAHPNSLAQALTAGASVYMLRREPDRLLARIDEGIAIAERHGYPVWIDHADFWVGWALAEKGLVEEGIVHLRKALVAYRKHGAGSSLPKFLGLLADRLGEVGRFDEGLALLGQAVEHIERTQERANEAETWRLRGKLLFARNADDFAAAEAAVRRAIEMARRQEAKAWELRAATTLASMLRSRGQRQKARECLAPVHDWFREGVDTPDLEDARALLRELS